MSFILGVLHENPLWLEIVDDFRACQSRPLIRFLVAVVGWSLRGVLQPRAALVLEAGCASGALPRGIAVDSTSVNGRTVATAP
jgi:hypothetical protein